MAVLYVTLDDFKSWVGLTETADDSVVVDGIAASSAAIDNYCNTHFWQTASGTRVFDTCDPYSVRIGEWSAVTAVATDSNGDGTYDITWTAPADYQLLPINTGGGPDVLPFTEIRAIGTKTFPPATRRLGRIQVTGTEGWPAVPEPVLQACMLITNRLVKRRRSPEGVAGFDEFGTVRISQRDDPDALRLLAPYRTQNRAGGWAFA